MEKILLSLIAAVGGTAAFASDFDFMGNFEFIAPAVPDRTSGAIHKQSGLIVYDSGSDDFYGVDMAGSWLNLSRRLSPLYANSDVKTPGASGDYALMTNNKITLTPGVWVLEGQGHFYSEGGSADFSRADLGWFAANGDDTAAEPLHNISFNFGLYRHTFAVSAASTVIKNAPTMRITVTSGTKDVYLVPRPYATTIANARVKVAAWAERVDY